MSILIEPDAWLRGLAGGACIGLAAALLLALSGRIAGISGILSGLLFDRESNQLAWRALFLLGLVAGPLLAGQLHLMQPVSPVQGLGATIVAGLLVGFGTRLGSGCTSGHGICGMARFSKRSFAATATFMIFGFITVFLVRHGGGA